MKRPSVLSNRCSTDALSSKSSSKLVLVLSIDSSSLGNGRPILLGNTKLQNARENIRYVDIEFEYKSSPATCLRFFFFSGHD